MSFWFLTPSNEIGALEETWSSIILLPLPEGGNTALAMERKPVSSLHFQFKSHYGTTSFLPIVLHNSDARNHGGS